jgi:hypothetical protein
MLEIALQYRNPCIHLCAVAWGGLWKAGAEEPAHDALRRAQKSCVQAAAAVLSLEKNDTVHDDANANKELIHYARESGRIVPLVVAEPK